MHSPLMRIEDVARTHTYALAGMLTHDEDLSDGAWRAGLRRGPCLACRRRAPCVKGARRRWTVWDL